MKLNPNIAIGVSLALFVVWEGRQGGWTDMFQAMTGKLVIVGTRGTGVTTIPSSGGKKPTNKSSTQPSTGLPYVGKMAA